MISANHPHDRENLSALFDGELHGDASRFAHKRLAQDVQWRQACGTWQLVGDALRGHATAAAPADFADRVQLALAHESAAAMMSSTSRSRRGWVRGAALAASVAIAAWFVASPLDEAAPANLPAATVATAMPPGAAPDPVAVPLVAVAAEDTAPSEVARPSRARGQRTAVPYSRAPAADIAAAAPALASQATADLGGIDPATLADPFRLPDPPATRPWPRAVLPDFPATGALTAGYGVGPQNSGVVASDAPGFYPFEPRLPPDPAPDAQ